MVPVHSPEGKPSVWHTCAQLLFLMQAPTNLWLCDTQCRASATRAGPISAHHSSVRLVQSENMQTNNGRA